MARRCSICQNGDRQSIEEAVRRGEEYRAIASTFRVGRCAVQRHVANHMALDEVAQAAVKLGLNDAANVPTDIAERGSLIQRLIDECIEPLMNPGGTIKDVPTSLLITLLKLQQADNVIVLKANGLLQSDNKSKQADHTGTLHPPVAENSMYTDLFNQILELIDAIALDGPEVAQ